MSIYQKQEHIFFINGVKISRISDPLYSDGAVFRYQVHLPGGPPVLVESVDDAAAVATELKDHC